MYFPLNFAGMVAHWCAWFKTRPITPNGQNDTESEITILTSFYAHMGMPLFEDLQTVKILFSVQILENMNLTQSLS